MARIAVEQPFIDVKEELRSLGFEAEMLQQKTDAPDYDCVVVRGIEDLTDIRMNVPMIEAKGRTVSEIVEDVISRLQRTGEIKDMTSSRKSGSQWMNGMLVGTVVGAAAGFLLAPKSGKDLRHEMNEKALQTKEQTTNIANKVKEKSSEAKANVTRFTKENPAAFTKRKDKEEVKQ